MYMLPLLWHARYKLDAGHNYPSGLLKISKEAMMQFLNRRLIAALTSRSSLRLIPPGGSRAACRLSGGRCVCHRDTNDLLRLCQSQQRQHLHGSAESDLQTLVYQDQLEPDRSTRASKTTRSARSCWTCQTTRPDRSTRSSRINSGTQCAGRLLSDSHSGQEWDWTHPGNMPGWYSRQQGRLRHPPNWALRLVGSRESPIKQRLVSCH
jgi:hypothetical protein